MNEYQEKVVIPIVDSNEFHYIQELRDGLETVISSLISLNSITEEEFLLTGGNLNEYKLKCKKLISESTELSENLSGELLLEKIGKINDMSFQLLDHMQADIKNDNLSFGLLNEIEKLLVNVTEEITGFKKIIKTLKMLGMSTLIENARLGDEASGFNALATDVESLANNIQEKSHQIDNETKQLLKLIKDTIGKNISLGKEQQGKIKTIISELGADLRVLEQKHNLKVDTVSHILIGSENINTDVSQVVTSVQFHDITRQQIEHVINSLKNIYEELSEITPDCQRVEVEKKIALVRDISRLESAQLENSSKIFIEAVENIKESLYDIHNSIGNITKELTEFLSDSDHQGNSFLSEITEGLNRVTEVLSESSVINDRLNKSITEVGQTVFTLSQFLQSIEEIGEEVELLAINASIKAAHTGSEGAGLGVIADAIQKLSSEAMNQTIRVAKPLKQITEDAEKLTLGNDSDFNNSVEKEIKKITEEMESTLITLNNINTDSGNVIKQMNDEVSSLQKNIFALHENIKIHNKISSVSEKCKHVLEALVKKCVDEIGENYKEDNIEILNKIAERYTMLSEREIHSQINESINVESGMAEYGYQSEYSENELGDNIELF